jgi:hypothetical protein
MATASDQNLQHISPFLHARRRLVRRRSAFAILTGLLVHSLCNLFIGSKLPSGLVQISSILFWFQKAGY